MKCTILLMFLLACGVPTHGGNENIVLVARRNYILRISSDKTGFPATTIPVTGLANAVAIDYDPVDGYVYWSDVARKTISRAKLDGTNQLVIVSTGLVTPDGIAVDSAGRKLYWTDTGTDKIEVALLDGKSRKALISANLREPRAIVVDGKGGQIYWTDWGSNPAIERAALDGSGRTVLVNTDLGWPNGLAIDFSTKRMYWADAKLDRIEVVNLDGTGRQKFVTTNTDHIYGLSILGDYIYWTEWIHLGGSVQRVNKKDASSRLTVSHSNGLKLVMGLKAVTIYGVATPAIVDSTTGATLTVLTVGVGSALSFKCKYPAGSTVAETAWYKDGSSSPISQGANAIYSKTAASKADAGKYTCKIKVGTTWSPHSASLTVEVNFATPAIVDSTTGATVTSRTVKLGTSISFRCKPTDGSTVVDTAWYMDGTSSPVSQGSNVYSITTAGKYTCKIKVGGAWSLHSASLVVEFHDCTIPKKPLGMKSKAINAWQISASGVPATSTAIKETVRLGDETGGTDKTGLCIDANLKEKRITIDFRSGANKMVLLTGFAIQTWKNWVTGDPYVKSLKMSYEGIDGKVHQEKDPWPGVAKPTWGTTNEYHFSKSKWTMMNKIFIDIVDFQVKPCLRLEFFGCPQVLCNPPCLNEGKCIAKNTCECKKPYGPPNNQCKYKYPETVKEPTLVTVDAGNNEVMFKCKVTPVTGQKFTADFYVDENKVVAIHSQPNPTDGAIAGEFKQDKLYIVNDGNGNLIFPIKDDNGNPRKVYRVPKGIRCAVRACYTKDNSCDYVKSSPKFSNYLTGTANVKEDTIDLDEGGGPKTVTVTFDGPPILFQDLTYAAVGSRTAHVEIQFDKATRKYKCSGNQQIITKKTHYAGPEPYKSHCGIGVTPGNWHTTFLLQALATTDGLMIPITVKRKAGIWLKQIDHKGGQVESKSLKTINVNVKNADGWNGAVKNTNCYSSNDPHMQTHDGTRHEGQVTEEHVGQRNIKNGFQINAVYMPCYGSYATCNCAVAVRAGDDVIVVSGCPRHAKDMEDIKKKKKTKGYVKAYMWLNDELTPGFKIYRVSRGWSDQYYIYLPSGTYVQINVYPWSSFISNYVVVPSIADRDHTEGLCGFYNGDCKDDLRERGTGKIHPVKNCREYRNFWGFLNSWKATASNGLQLMYGVPKGDKIDNRKWTYCRCLLDSHSSDCGEHVLATPCPPDGAVDLTESLRTKFSYKPTTVKPQRGRRRRSAGDVLYRSERAVPDPAGEDDVYLPVFHDDSYVPKDVSWPTAGGWTEAKARKFCEDYLLNNEAVKNCKTMMKSDFQDEINGCIFDIKVTDGTDFAETTLKTILGQCVTMVDQYPSDVTDLPGGIKRTVLLSSLCQNNCNNNGKCDDGRCVCNAGFYGSMCSLTKDKPPEISYLSRDGLCNTRGRDCTRSEVFGYGYIESSDLICRITPYNHLTGKRDDSNQFTTTAQYINMNLILCPHDKKNGTFMVAVSNNNGGTYSSEELLYLAYDGICYTCTIDQDNKRGNCSRLNTGCGIGTACFKAEQLDPDSECRICDPIRSVSSWSVNTKLSRCTPTPVDNTLAIALGVTAAVVFIAAVIGIVFGVKKCKQTKSVGPPETDNYVMDPVEEVAVPEATKAEQPGSIASIQESVRKDSTASVTDSGRISVTSLTQIWTRPKSAGRRNRYPNTVTFSDT